MSIHSTLPLLRQYNLVVPCGDYCTVSIMPTPNTTRCLCPKRIFLTASTNCGCVLKTRTAWPFSFNLEKMNLPWLASHSQIQWGRCHHHQIVCDMANNDLKSVAAMNLARITPHHLDVVSESRPRSQCYCWCCPLMSVDVLLETV